MTILDRGYVFYFLSFYSMILGWLLRPCGLGPNEIGHCVVCVLGDGLFKPYILGENS